MRKGLTLIEVIVTMAILVIIIATIPQIFSSTIININRNGDDINSINSAKTELGQAIANEDYTSDIITKNTKSVDVLGTNVEVQYVESKIEAYSDDSFFVYVPPTMPDTIVDIYSEEIFEDKNYNGIYEEGIDVLVPDNDLNYFIDSTISGRGNLVIGRTPTTQSKIYILFSEDVIVYPGVTLNSNSYVTLDCKNVTFYDNTKINASTYIHFYDDGKIILGDNVNLNATSFVTLNSIYNSLNIGDNLVCKSNNSYVYFFTSKEIVVGNSADISAGTYAHIQTNDYTQTQLIYGFIKIGDGANIKASGEVKINSIYNKINIGDGSKFTSTSSCVFVYASKEINVGNDANFNADSYIKLESNKNGGGVGTTTINLGENAKLTADGIVYFYSHYNDINIGKGTNLKSNNSYIHLNSAGNQTYDNVTMETNNSYIYLNSTNGSINLLNNSNAKVSNSYVDVYFANSLLINGGSSIFGNSYVYFHVYGTGGDITVDESATISSGNTGYLAFYCNNFDLKGASNLIAGQNGTTTINVRNNLNISEGGTFNAKNIVNIDGKNINIIGNSNLTSASQNGLFYLTASNDLNLLEGSTLNSGYSFDIDGKNINIKGASSITSESQNVAANINATNELKILEGSLIKSNNEINLTSPSIYASGTNVQKTSFISGNGKDTKFNVDTNGKIYYGELGSTNAYVSFVGGSNSGYGLNTSNKISNFVEGYVIPETQVISNKLYFK